MRAPLSLFMVQPFKLLNMIQKTRCRQLPSFLQRPVASFSSAVSWPPKLESATGRARRRRRRIAAANKKTQDQTLETEIPLEQTISPKGWRVLWPQPHGDRQSFSLPTKRIPNGAQWKAAWLDYKSTWAAGLRGYRPVPEEASSDTAEETFTNKDMKHNLEQNRKALQDEAREVGANLSNRTGIHNTDDLRAFATEMMHLATECLKEFMTGYRQGRDQEVDRMLNEYFQEEEEEADQQKEAANRKRRRKPKRAVLRP